MLVAYVKEALTMSRNPLYTMFVKLKSALNPALRNKLMLILADAGFHMNMVNLLVAILQENRITVDDEAA